MTPRERVLRALRHQPTDRVPLDYWASSEFDQRLQKYLRLKSRAEVLDLLGVDIRSAHPQHVDSWSRSEGKRIVVDAWGVRYREQKFSFGTAHLPIERPMAIAQSTKEVEKWNWPEPQRLYDFAEAHKRAKGFARFAVVSGVSEVFTPAAYLLGELGLLEALAARPQIVEAIVERVVDFYLERNRLLFEGAAKSITLTEVTDPYATKAGPLISPAMFERFAVPHLRRFVEQAAEYGAATVMHCRGACALLLPGMIAAGVAALNPVEVGARGMELQELQPRFGEQICFHGGFDADLLRFGSPDVIRETVRSLLGKIGADGGLILAPSRDIDEDTPPENVVAMYEEARAFPLA